MGFANTGKVWTPDSLRAYLKNISRPLWINGICLHHCAEPSLAQRPQGFKAQHLDNLKDFYQNQKGWSSAPHLFIDEDQVWGMCPFEQMGVHAVSFNRTHLGIEVLGDYDSESPLDSRGLQCWETTFACVRVLLEWLGLPANESTIKFHRDDPKTTKTCPGTKVTKAWVLQSIANVTSVTPAVKIWVIQNLENGLTFNGIERNGRPFAGVRDFVKFMGGDETKIKVEGTDFSYDGHELEFAYVDGTRGYAPVRELVDALGLRIVDARGFRVTVGKR